MAVDPNHPPAVTRPVEPAGPAFPCHDACASAAQARRLSRILTLLPAGVVILDAHGRIAEHNPAAEGLLGVSLAGRPWREIVASGFGPRPDDGHDVSLRDGRRVNISTCPLADEPGQIVLIKDVTEPRRLQDAVARQQRLTALGEMAATLAHQMRTPLAAALLYAAHLQRPDLAAEARMGFAGKLVSRLEHMEQLIRDLLAFVRGDGIGRLEAVSVQAVLDAAAGMVEARLHASGTALRVEPLAEALEVWGDPDALITAVQNLIANGIDACPDGGRVRIGATGREADRVEIWVEDTGAGMDPAVAQRIFEPFFTTRPAGTGLGLTVVQAVARAHGGEVLVDQGRAGGTRVRLVLTARRANTELGAPAWAPSATAAAAAQAG